MVHTQRTVRVKCAVYPMLHHPPPPRPMHMYGQRAAQNGRLWVTFFVTKGGWGGSMPDPSPPPPLYPSLAGKVWPSRGPGCAFPLPQSLGLLVESTRRKATAFAVGQGRPSDHHTPAVSRLSPTAAFEPWDVYLRGLFPDGGT